MSVNCLSFTLCTWKLFSCFSLVGSDLNKNEAFNYIRFVPHILQTGGFERRQTPVSCLAFVNTLCLLVLTSLTLTLAECSCFYSQVQQEFDLLEFNKMCWTLCFKKNICTKRLLFSDDDAFKVWCIFNFLSEDKYPLVIVTEEVRKMITVVFFGVCAFRNKEEGNFEGDIPSSKLVFNFFSICTFP